MSKFRMLRQTPPKLNVKKDVRELIITTISCMCDNIQPLKLKKNSEGDFKLNGMGNSLSNWQMQYPVYEIEWKADEGKFDEVFKMINSGTSVIEKVMSR